MSLDGPTACLRQRPVWATLIVLAGIAAYQLWSLNDAAGKLEATGLAGIEVPVDVEVVVAIEPEQFHMTLFQNAGRLVEVRMPSVYLKDVPPANLRRLAGYYWVAAVRPWEAP